MLHARPTGPLKGSLTRRCDAQLKRSGPAACLALWLLTGRTRFGLESDVERVDR